MEKNLEYFKNILKARVSDENFEEASNEAFVNPPPISLDFDDTGDDVNIEQHEARIHKQSEIEREIEHHLKHHNHLPFMHGGRICCSAHRKHDPYFNIESKVKSFENFDFHPSIPNFHVSKLRFNNIKYFKF